jgi:hypothetical protein
MITDEELTKQGGAYDGVLQVFFDDDDLLLCDRDIGGSVL